MTDRIRLADVPLTTAAELANAYEQADADRRELAQIRDNLTNALEQAHAELAELRDRLTTIRQIADEAAAVTGADEQGSVYDHPEPNGGDR